MRSRPAPMRTRLETDFAKLARELGALPRVFSHRDFHGNNIFVQGDIAYAENCASSIFRMR